MGDGGSSLKQRAEFSTDNFRTSAYGLLHPTLTTCMSPVSHCLPSAWSPVLKCSFKAKEYVRKKTNKQTKTKKHCLNMFKFNDAKLGNL